MTRRGGWLARLTERLFGGEIARRIALVTRALDDVRDRSWGKNESDRDRRAFKREEILKDALAAWRENPLARRIVDLTSDYVVGGGLSVESADGAANDFLREWWGHRLNRMSVRMFEWCDELTRSGELFPVVSTDAAGMSYLRAIPAAEIVEIKTAGNDLEQETLYLQVAVEVGADPKPWPAYDERTDARDGSGEFPAVMLHYAVNRPVGALRGESDLAPLLRWLTRYSAWLEDRVRLNRFRQTFLFWVKAAWRDNAERLARQAELNATPPSPGSFLVTDESEDWSVLHPKLDSFEAREDGLAVKKMLAAGAGTPLHFLAEPESSTRTTAEQAGGPTFRHYDRRQLFFLWMIRDLAQIAVRRRAMVDSAVQAGAAVKVSGQDVSVRDNAMLAEAAERTVTSFILLRDRGLIDDAELMRMAYKFAGEVVDVAALLARGPGASSGKAGVG